MDQLADLSSPSIRTRSLRRTIAVAGLGIAGAAIWLTAGAPRTPPSTPAAATQAAPVLSGTALSSDALARRIYPYSVVPGGVLDRAELAQVIKSDKVVAAHYAGFDVEAARPVKVSKARSVHVSYRKGDRIYWTRDKVMLAEGETLLSDGTHEVRTRCANRISDVAMLPVADSDPSTEVLDSFSEAGADGAPQAAAAEASAQGPAVSTRLHTFANASAMAVAGGAESDTRLLGGSGLSPAGRTYTRWGELGSGDTESTELSGNSGAGGPEPDVTADTPTVLLPGVISPMPDLPGGDAPPVPPVLDLPGPAPQPLPPAPVPADLEIDLPLPSKDPVPPPPFDPERPMPWQPEGPAEGGEGDKIIAPPQTQVPEPGSLWLIGAALGTLCWRARKRRPHA